MWRSSGILLMMILLCIQLRAQENLLSQDSITHYLQLAKEEEEKGDYRQAALYLNSIGNTHWEQKNYSGAIGVYKEALRLNGLLGNRHAISGIQNNLGMIYADQGDYQQSAVFLTKTLKARKKEKDPYSITSALINLVVVTNHLQRYDTSIVLLKEALGYARERNDANSMKSCYGMLAETYEKQGNTEQMVHYFDLYRSFHELVQAEKERESKRIVAEINTKAKGLELEKRKQEMALQLEQESLKLREQELAQAQAELKEIEQLLASADSSKRTLLLHADKKDLIIYALKEQEVRQQMQIEQKQTIQRILFIGLAVVFVLSLILLYFFLNKQKMNRRLSQALSDAQQAVEAKAQFLSTMSHEIRTPLNSVIGYTQLLQMEEPQAHQIEHLQTLEFSSKHLLSLVNDVLDFSKIEAGKLSLEKQPFSLDDLLLQLKQIFAFKAQEKQIDLILDHDPTSYNVVGDQVRLGQILTNLIGNAIKFTLEGRVVFGYQILSVDAQEVQIRFEVLDTGVGIPAEKIDDIFEIFSQASIDTTRKFGGTGLGLSISKKLVEIQGGRIWAESELGVGTRFYVELSFPIQERQVEAGDHNKQAISTDSPRVPTLSEMKVLVVDDNAINRKIAQRFLAKWDIDSNTAENGEEAIQMIKTKAYDLVLMDLNMPVMDGEEATRIIRSQAGVYFQQLPIIAFSATSSSEVNERIQTCGMNGFLPKPFKASTLYDILITHSQTHSSTAFTPQSPT